MDVMIKGMYVTDCHCDGCDDKGDVCDRVSL